MGKDISYQDAVIYWCEKIYMPIVDIILERYLIVDFPKISNENNT
jgi:hypothetical protein